MIQIYDQFSVMNKEKLPSSSSFLVLVKPQQNLMHPSHLPFITNIINFHLYADKAISANIACILIPTDKSLIWAKRGSSADDLRCFQRTLKDKFENARYSQRKTAWGTQKSFSKNSNRNWNSSLLITKQRSHFFIDCVLIAYHLFIKKNLKRPYWRTSTDKY